MKDFIKDVGEVLRGATIVITVFMILFALFCLFMFCVKKNQEPTVVAINATNEIQLKVYVEVEKEGGDPEVRITKDGAARVVPGPDVYRVYTILPNGKKGLISEFIK